VRTSADPAAASALILVLCRFCGRPESRPLSLRPRPLTARSKEAYVESVKKVVFSLVLGYLVLALASRAKESAGLLTCDCYQDCWCRRPGLSLFRWVFPRFHHNPGLEAWKKHQLDSAW